jgi:predicted ribosome quality control (RQC) complex YloA/Tae2 family protein
MLFIPGGFNPFTLRVEIDVRKSARENAALLFDRAKKLREKAKRARALVEGESKPKAESKKKAPSRKREWFEKFRNFISSEGNLVLGGRDAATNELLIKKHLGNHDTVFHADPAGSPFVVIRGKCGENTLAEAATFCASYSRAWQARLGSVDVYWVTPEQVSKKAPAGEYISKGSFMINGRKNYFKNVVLELSVFLREGRVFASPPQAAPDGAIKVIPGAGDRKAIIGKLREQLAFAGSDDEIDKLLPPGKCDLR